MIFQIFKIYLNPVTVNPKKMVKHTQTIRRLLRTDFLIVFDYFVGLGIKG